jgi:hypothetical protein
VVQFENHQQVTIAKQCEILVRAFAKVGIVALGWIRTFPIEFYKQVFKLKGWNWGLALIGGLANDSRSGLAEVVGRLAGLVQSLYMVRKIIGERPF